MTDPRGESFIVLYKDLGRVSTILTGGDESETGSSLILHSYKGRESTTLREYEPGTSVSYTLYTDPGSGSTTLRRRTRDRYLYTL